MIEEIEGRRDDLSAVNFGLNQSVSSVGAEFSHFIELENFRLNRDGSRLEKRNGLVEIADLVGHSPVYGYSTYYNESSQFCEVAVTAAKIWRRVAGGDWTAIHTWSSTLSHPVKIFECQDKIFIMTEIENKVIHYDGTISQVGISAPTTIPTITASYDATLLNEDCAVITDWTDADIGAAASSQATFDSKSCMRLLCTGVVGDIARRYRTVTGIGDVFVLELDVYLNTVDIHPKLNHFQANVYNGQIGFQVRVDKNDIYINGGGFWSGVMATINQDVWMKLKFLVDSSTPGEEYCEIFKDGESLGEFLCGNRTEKTPGFVEVMAYGNTVATDVYLDNIIVAGVEGGQVSGLRRFAVTYLRDGNYPCESNPIRSYITAPALTGIGINDLTIAGEYTGGKKISLRVEIEAVGFPDTFKWSTDNGKTWAQTGVRLASSVKINYGIELKWGAVVGHSLGDFWSSTCYSMSVDACRQRITLTNIPVPTDPQVTKKRIYCTTSGGVAYYLVGTIEKGQTTFVYNLPDTAMGVALESDRDIAPLGEMACLWDDRVWTLDCRNHILYYSEINRPEEYSRNSRWINVRMGDTQNTPTAVVPFGKNLYVFKKNSILRIEKKTGGGYGRYDLHLGEVGAVAGWSVQEVAGLLTFMSARGYEAFNGESLFEQDFFEPVLPTVKLWDKTKPNRINSCHHQDQNELLVSIPDRTGGASAVTIALNYVAGKFYVFTFPVTPIVMTRARDSTGEMKTYFGTNEGHVYEFDSGTTDDGTNITAIAGMNWRRERKVHNWRQFECEFEAPEANTLTFNLYVDFKSTASRTKAMPGNTPSSVDASLRLPLVRMVELGINGRYARVEFVNSEDIGSDLKINYMGLVSGEKEKRDDIEAN